MKKFFRWALCALILSACIGAILNIATTTKQGINYEVYTHKVPLYLKILDFFDRHYNYQQLTKRIISDADTGEIRAMKIFNWTYNNIRRVPEGFPVIDDHVWHIIVRGYAASDQSCDVFATLCNYAGINAFFSKVYKQDKTGKIPLSFVKLDEKWYVFDPYRGVCFKGSDGNMADIETIRLGKDWRVECLGQKPDIDYAMYFNNLFSIDNPGFLRSNIQSPLRRFFFEISRYLKARDKGEVENVYQ